MAGELEELAQRLDAIADELEDLGLQRLRDAIDNGGHELPVDERQIARARRAVLKASNLLVPREQW